MGHESNKIRDGLGLSNDQVRMFDFIIWFASELGLAEHLIGTPQVKIKYERVGEDVDGKIKILFKRSNKKLYSIVVDRYGKIKGQRAWNWVN